jgi:hypothetical protein
MKRKGWHRKKRRLHKSWRERWGNEVAEHIRAFEESKVPACYFEMEEDKVLCAMMHEAPNPYVEAFKNHRRAGKPTMLGAWREEIEKL